METKLYKDDISQYEAHTNINWEKRRYEIAKAMIPYIYIEDRNRGLSTHINTRDNYIYKDAKDCAEDAVRYADALIEVLKGKNEVEESHADDNENNDTSFYEHLAQLKRFQVSEAFYGTSNDNDF